MREFSIIGNNVTLANQAVSLVAVMPPAGGAIEILRAWISQHSSTTSAQQRVNLCFKASAFQTVVTATPQKLKTGDPASLIEGVEGSIAAGKCGINASAENAGTLTPFFSDAFNVLNGFLWIPTPRETIIITGASSLAFCVHFPAAPSSLTGWNFGVAFAELG